MERVVSEAQRTLKSPDQDAVHDFRVATRRLLQGLRTFKTYFHRKPAKRIRRRLKDAFAAAGAVRDYDVAAKILAGTSQPGAALLRRRIRSRRRDAQTKLVLILKSMAFRRRVSNWCDHLNLNAPLAEFDGKEVEAMASTALPQLARRFFEAGEEAAAHGSGGSLHAFRILAKKFRYTLDLFAPLYGPCIAEYVRKIKSVQSVLGRMNDYRTVGAMAEEIGAARKLRSALKRNEHRKAANFRQNWAKEFSRATSETWIRNLARKASVNRMPVKTTEHGIPKTRTAA